MIFSATLSMLLIDVFLFSEVGCMMLLCGMNVGFVIRFQFLYFSIVHRPLIMQLQKIRRTCPYASFYSYVADDAVTLTITEHERYLLIGLTIGWI